MFWCKKQIRIIFYMYFVITHVVWVCAFIAVSCNNDEMQKKWSIVCVRVAYILRVSIGILLIRLTSKLYTVSIASTNSAYLEINTGVYCSIHGTCCWIVFSFFCSDPYGIYFFVLFHCFQNKESVYE